MLTQAKSTDDIPPLYPSKQWQLLRSEINGIARLSGGVATRGHAPQPIWQTAKSFMPIFSSVILKERKKMHHIELSEHSVETDAGVALARLKASRTESSSNQLQTQEFCKRLRSYTYLNIPSAMKARLGIDPTPIPQQFGAVRVIDSRDGLYLGSVWQLGNGSAPARYGFAYSVKHEKPTAGDVIAICQYQMFEEVTAWHDTRALPSTLPGVLDLVVDIETRPRQTLFVTGTSLSDDIKAFMAERAPRRI